MQANLILMQQAQVLSTSLYVSTLSSVGSRIILCWQDYLIHRKCDEVTGMLYSIHISFIFVLIAECAFELSTEM
jgi:hypothetical protein